jgi:Domain of unknown function (DUF4383)
MSSLPIIYRTGKQRESRSPAQIAAFVVGLSWVVNGIGAFLIDPNLATAYVHGSGELFGVEVTANGWHALLHLLSGVVGIAAAWRARAAFVYLLVAGALYIVMGTWGIIAGGASIGVIAVDTSGDLVHVIEGMVTFAAGVLTLSWNTFVTRRVGQPTQGAPVRNDGRTA